MGWSEISKFNTNFKINLRLKKSYVILIKKVVPYKGDISKCNKSPKNRKFRFFPKGITWIFWQFYFLILEFLFCEAATDEAIAISETFRIRRSSFYQLVYIVYTLLLMCTCVLEEPFRTISSLTQRFHWEPHKALSCIITAFYAKITQNLF